MDFELPNVREFRPPRVPGRALARLFVIVVLVILVFTTWFTIDPEEAGVVLRFGRVVRQVPPACT